LPRKRYEIEVFRGGPDPVEKREDGVLSAEGDVERVGLDLGKRPRFAPEFEPFGWATEGMEEDEVVAFPDELVAELEISADAPKDLDVGQERGDFHGRTAEAILSDGGPR
jgi:hypothetical protein